MSERSFWRGFRERLHGLARIFSRPSVVTTEPCWFEHPSGRVRLAAEAARLDALRLSFCTFLVDGDLAFAFDRGGGREIIAICGDGYPDVAPVLVAIHPTKGRHSIPVAAWQRSRLLAEVVAPLLGPSRQTLTDVRRGA